MEPRRSTLMPRERISAYRREIVTRIRGENGHAENVRFRFHLSPGGSI